MAAACRDYSVALIEQPLRRGDEQSLEGWMPWIPVAADESILDLSEVCDFVDLDGPYGLADDPLAKEIYSDGKIFVPEAIWGGA